MSERKYYVTMLRDKRYAFLLGPFATHDEALALVNTAQAEAHKVDPWSDFDAFGTGSLSGLIGYPTGRLNERLGVSPTA